MTHTALARKYRPSRFADLVAQNHVAAGLAGAVANNRVAHAYLLTGPRGVGKTSAARILAMALNCERRAAGGEGDVPPGEPCATCDSCRRIWSGAANFDVVEIDAASNRGVDDARDLRERAMYAASGPDRHKVYIVDEAHMLTREAWNALLKILEEPPPRVVFVFATTEPQKIANTAAPVMSRVQRFDFRRIGPAAIAERLTHVAAEEGIVLEDDALRLIARVADGGMRDALSLLDQALAFGDGAVSAGRVREALGLIGDETYAVLLDVVAARRTADVFPFVQRLAEQGADLMEFVAGLGEVLRAVLLTVLGGRPEGLTETLRTVVERHAAGFAEGDLLRMLRLLADAEVAIRRSPNARLHVETLLVQWTLLDRTVELADLLEALRGGGSPTAPPPAGRSGEQATRAGGEAAEGPRAASRRPPDRQEGRGEAREPPVRERPPYVRRDGPLTLDELRAAWPTVAETVGQRRRMLQEALAHARPAEVDGAAVTLEVSDSKVHLEGLERGRELVATAIREVTGRPATVRYRPVGEGRTAASEAPRRLDRDADRDERLRIYRTRDQSLDAVAEALDLELLE